MVKLNECSSHIQSLKISPFNVRSVIKKEINEEMEQLKQSIKKSGVIEPLIIRKSDTTGKPEVVVGQRRFIAAKQLGMKKIPCIWKELSDSEALEYSLIENLQRKDLDAIDIAEGLKKLYDMWSVTDQLSINQFADKLPWLGRTQIKQYLSLVNLTPELKDLVSDGKITIESGAKLKQLPEEVQKEFAQEFEKVVEKQQITQDVEDEIIDKVRKEPEKVKDVIKEVSESLSPDYVTIVIKTSEGKTQTRMKRKYFDYLTEVSVRMNTDPFKLLEDIIVEKLKEWGYKI